jgi:protein translocase SecG subunit
MIALLKVILWIVFFLSAFLLIVIVLLQESKGGGLSEAFGGMGAETFGVKSGGINRFTFTVAAFFMASAILLQALWNAG